MARDYCDTIVLLDRSGSMGKIRAATVEGLNNFVREQKDIPGEGCWTLQQFDDRYDPPTWVQLDQREVPVLSVTDFEPRGGTALIDAACRCIDETGARLAALPEAQRPDKVLFVIMTDGAENSSRLFSKQHLFDRIAEQREKYSWQFVFLGANMDAITVAQSYGIAAGSSSSYDHTAAGTHKVFGAVSKATRNWKLDGNQTADGLIIEPDVDVRVSVKVDSDK